MALTDKIKMDQNMEYGKGLRNFIFDVSGKLQNPIFDVLVLIGIILLCIIMIEATRNEKKIPGKKD